MRQIITLFFVGICMTGKGQDASVAKSVFGIQTGFLGIWAHNESRLSKKISLRIEAGFDAGIWAASWYEETGFVLVPMFIAEPRFYYNLDKRISKSRDIAKNSGNFLSLQTRYHPDWFVLSNSDGLSIISDIAVIPTWGIRRNMGNHINFETGIGIGCRFYLGENAAYLEEKIEGAVNLHLRVGYTF